MQQSDKKSQKPQQANQRNTNTDENIEKAYEQAETDIAKDAELSVHNEKDDLDEGESARLGEDKTDLI